MFPQMRAALTRELVTIIDSATQKIRMGVKQSAPIDVSGIRQNIRGMSGKIIIDTHYAPYHEYGTRPNVHVPSELKEDALKFKGRGIKQTNLEPRPFFYPHFFMQREKVITNIEKAIEYVMS